MEERSHKRWRAVGLCLVASCLAWATARAAIVDLDAYVEFSIMENDGVTPLADGSWVYIIGSGNSVADPIRDVWGAPPTDLIPNSVTGDDVILGIVQIGQDVISNGTFFTTVQYDSLEVSYVYIRFFDTTNYNITGMLYWGTSAVVQLGVTLGVSTVQFDPGGSLVATDYNNFVVIPKPTTGNLIVLVAGMIWAMAHEHEEEGQHQGGVGGAGMMNRLLLFVAVWAAAALTAPAQFAPLHYSAPNAIVDESASCCRHRQRRQPVRPSGGDGEA